MISRISDGIRIAPDSKVFMGENLSKSFLFNYILAFFLSFSFFFF